MPLGESQSGVASVMVSKEGGNSGSGRDRPTGGPRGLGPPWPKEKKEKKYLELLAQSKKKKRIFLMIIYINIYIYIFIYLFIYLFISRVVPRFSKNLDLFSFN